MNNGAFGEGFPYTNFHELNMDWIVKIAKDFLDQYTHIQEVIANGEESLQDLTTDGLKQLQTKADALETMLQQWYDTHSEDIANQLADALTDLNEWYTTHQGYLDQYVTDSVNSFTAQANQKAEETIATIPADYTEVADSIRCLKDSLLYGSGALDNNILRTAIWTQGKYSDQNGEHNNPNYFMSNKLPVTGGSTLLYTNEGFFYTFYNNDTFVSGGVITARTSVGKLSVPSTANYVVISKHKDSIHDEEVYENTVKIGKPLLACDPIYNFHVTGIGDSGNLQDANDAIPGLIYLLGSGSSISSIANMPNPAPDDDYEYFFLTLQTEALIQNWKYPYHVRKIQVLFSTNFQNVYTRQYHTKSWKEWRHEKSEPTGTRTVYVKQDGTGDFTKFTDALRYAFDYPNTDIIVYPGVYDIASEIDIENTGVGPIIGNNTRVFFKQNAIIQCIYTGGDSAVETRFSPLNAGTGDFEIHDMTIIATNVRYCVHDERSGDGKPYKHLYENCTMYHDLRNTVSWKSYQCIGGGFGYNGCVEIRGGYYEAYITTTQAPETLGEITYHLPVTTETNSKNTLRVEGVYCKNSTVRALCGGSSQEMSDFVINNCSLKLAPSVYYDPNDPNISYENFKMIEWNNTIHN